MLLSSVLCRLCSCASPGRAGRGRAAGGRADAKGSEENSSDDLTAIRGVGIAIQNRLYVAGITSYAELAQASAEDVRKIAGALARGAKVENWIARAVELNKRQKA